MHLLKMFGFLSLIVIAWKLQLLGFSFGLLLLLLQKLHILTLLLPLHWNSPSELRGHLLGLSLQYVHRIKYNSQVLDCAVFPVDSCNTSYKLEVHAVVENKIINEVRYRVEGCKPQLELSELFTCGINLL